MTPEAPEGLIREATEADAEVLARLLNDFNAEFDEETLPSEDLARRYRELLSTGEVRVLLSGEGPDGFAQLHLQGSVYTEGPEAYLGELYVVPEKRGQGLGRALMDAAMDAARAAGAEHMSLVTGETDVAARGLYESKGFTNREGSPDGPVMLYYERDL